MSLKDLRRDEPRLPMVLRLHRDLADEPVRGRCAVQFIRIRQVLEMIGVSRTTLWRMVQAGTFPRPVCITERNRGYERETVEAWMTARTEEGANALAIPPVVRRREAGRAAARAALARLPRTG